MAAPIQLEQRMTTAEEREAMRCGTCGVPWDEHTDACTRHAFRPVPAVAEALIAATASPVVPIPAFIYGLPLWKDRTQAECLEKPAAPFPIVPTTQCVVEPLVWDERIRRLVNRETLGKPATPGAPE
jgi:hypothetical protein